LEVLNREVHVAIVFGLHAVVGDGFEELRFTQLPIGTEAQHSLKC
jgi:hypothetical protein